MMRKDSLDPLLYTDCMPSLMSATGRVDVHSVVAHYLMDNQISGSYLEFGVGKGRSAVSALRAYGRAGVCDHFHLFDSFVGLPKPEGVDVSGPQFKESDFAYSESQVQAFLIEHDVWDEARVNFHPGWFENTLPGWIEHAVDSHIKVAVVHLDMDLYNSCLTVLNALTPLLRTGVVMIFDDWNCFSASNQAGERAAVRKWLSQNPGISLNPWISYGWHGQVFFCDALSEGALK